MKIGDRVFVHGYIDEIRKDIVIIRNNGGYFGTVPSEVVTGELPSAQPELPIKKKCTICPHCDNCDVNDDGTIAQPEPCDDPRADVYYLAEKIGIHRLYALVVELRGEPEQRWIPCGKCIHADGKHRWCKVLDRTINEDYFCYWAEPFRKEGEADG